jgi:hypothetical protein
MTIEMANEHDRKEIDDLLSMLLSMPDDRIETMSTSAVEFRSRMTAAFRALSGMMDGYPTAALLKWRAEREMIRAKLTG